jgi:hypothetical protein
MSVTTCGAGDGGTGNEGGAKSEGAFGLRSGRAMVETAAAISDAGVAVGVTGEGVIGTVVVIGLRSGRGRLSASATAELRSGRGIVTVSVAVRCRLRRRRGLR